MKILEKLLALVAVFALAATLHAWTASTKPLWTDGNIPIQIQLGASPAYSDGTTPNQTAQLAIDEWNPLMARVQLIGQVTSNSTPGNSVIFSDTVAGEPFGEGVLAVATGNYENGQRIEADIIVNSRKSWDSYRGTVREVTYDLRRVLIHEFGHVLGLGHPDENGQNIFAIMNSIISSAEVPTDDDRDGIGALYGFTPGNPGRPPSGISGPFNLTIEEGEPFSMTVHVSAGNLPFEYQWFQNGEPISGATSPRYEGAVSHPEQSGGYFVRVTNSVGTVTSQTAQLVVTRIVLPEISGELPNISIIKGGGKRISGWATGSKLMHYQWFRNGTEIPGATNTYISLFDVGEEDAGFYHFTATNVIGTTTSPAFRVSVYPLPLPSWGQRVSNESLQAPDSVWNPLVPVIYTSVQPTYQWYKDGVLLPGKTSESISVQANFENGGDYTLIASNASGSTTHSPLSLTPWVDTTPPHGWSNITADDRTVFFLLDQPARIERFDLTSGQFLSPISLPATASHFALVQDRIYYSVGREIRRVNRDGTNDEAVFNTELSPWSFFAVDRFLYLLFGGETGTIFVSDDGAVPSPTSSSGLLRYAQSTSSNLRKIFATGQNKLARSDFDENGRIMAPVESPYYYRNFSVNTRSKLLLGETRICLSDGVVFDTSTLEPVGGLPRFIDATDMGDNRFVILRGYEAVMYDENLQELGITTFEKGAHAIASHQNRVYTFHSPTERGGAVTATPLESTAFKTRAVARSIDPEKVSLTAEDRLIDRNGDLHIFSSLHASILTWSVKARKFARTVPLSRGAALWAYSEHDHRIYIGHTDRRITYLDLNASSPIERPFILSLNALRGLSVVDSHLLVISQHNSAIYTTYDNSGRRIDEWINGPLSYSIIWNSFLQRFYHFSDNSSSEHLYAQSVKPNGEFDHVPQHNGHVMTSDTARPPVVVSPNGDKVLVRSGRILDANTFLSINTLASNIETGAWIGEKIYSANQTINGSEITRWNGPALLADKKFAVPGFNPQLFTLPDQRLLATTVQNNRLIITVLDADLQLISQDSHRGADLTTDTGRLSNLSTRVLLAENPSSPLIAGFVIEGADPLPVIIRAIGPSLSNFGVSDFLPDPTIRLFDQTSVSFASNDNWSSSTNFSAQELRDAFTRVGAFPLNSDSRDAAIRITLAPGAYTAQVTDKLNERGIVLLEVYADGDAATSARLVNLSTRTYSGENETALVAGFVVEGALPQSILIRAAGPELSRFGVTDGHTDPALTVRNSTQGLVVSNDDWAGDAQVRFIASKAGAFPFENQNGKDAAVSINLDAGPYTAEVTSDDSDKVGNTLVEVYHVED